jgi:hypothetical protein
MRSVLILGRWFYPAGISLLAWLAALTLLVFLLSGVRRRIVASTVVALCGIGALVCLSMIAAETVVYEFSSPLSVAGYAVLLAVFAYRLKGVAALALAGVAYSYLFIWARFPMPSNCRGTRGHGGRVNVLGGWFGTLPVRNCRL